MVESSISQYEIDEMVGKFKVIEMSRLQSEIERAVDNGRYVIVIDKNENASVFFSYKANLKEFYRESISVELGQKTKEEALEYLRKGIV